ncbi:hypothetical protein SELMODRAFT_156847 [Selaginella moellendorffii]|uniref:Uncharacterized protein n=1 Tax=Selaginella moellendorffii TaxID=88036 RepID=D8SN26_SELML|nr:mitochondrial outer membrane protein porin of 36 kDa [Selaginella moellendorffii]XP_024545792.1 mitochondrial outer membrane protein porin of 36 kDa [Selaginella moellendorffii]EFJ12979.1 hypothetical protein SELMODRAFT_271809 [Selaginella moellendorffii]EFJ13990.1 hypothetical protein SELMODRAFT_156847 [Selaginella moellendorffii]|eukprot:XP_002985802.1 mitochondrial outer membrane protein porin of 36 kDa [Selaginella moellendorffii]
MGKGPGMFSDIGRSTRDLLNKDYFYDHKFTVTTTTSSGLTFTSTGTRKGESLGGELCGQFKHYNITTDVKVDTNSNVYATVTGNEVSQGVKAIIGVNLPNVSTGKVEVHYVHDNVGITSAVGLTASPPVDVTAAFGNKEYSLGGAVSLDTAAGTVKKYEAGLGITKPDFTAALLLCDKGDTVKVSYSHTVSPLTKATVGAEVVHSISKKLNTFTIGGAYNLDLLTTVKARLNNQGKLAALIQHEFRPKSLLTISGEVDTKSLNKDTKVGLALSLKP